MTVFHAASPESKTDRNSAWIASVSGFDEEDHKSVSDRVRWCSQSFAPFRCVALHGQRKSQPPFLDGRGSWEDGLTFVLFSLFHGGTPPLPREPEPWLSRR